MSYDFGYMIGTGNGPAGFLTRKSRNVFLVLSLLLGARAAVRSESLVAVPLSLDDRAGLDAFYDNAIPRHDRFRWERPLGHRLLRPSELGRDGPATERYREDVPPPGAVGARPGPVATPPPAAGVPFNGVELPRVAFPGQDPVAEYLVEAIDGTQASLKLILYDFNLQEVLEAIRRARDRKPPVQVQVVLDEGHVFPSKPGARPSPQIQALIADPKVQVRIIRGFDEFGTMHNKIAIFDDQLVKFGSFNWVTAARDRHYENAVFTRDPKRLRLYIDYFAWLWKNAQPPDRRHGPPTLTPDVPRDRTRSVRFKNRLFPAVVFSPHGGASQWIIEAIHNSKSSIHIAMFSFYHQGLADALLERKLKGVEVRIVLDRTQAGNSPVVKFLKEHGFSLKIIGGRSTAGHSVMHNKYALFDGEMVETGSHNWTNNAENNNFENANFLDDPGEVAAFKQDFQRLWDKAILAADAFFESPVPPLAAAP